MKADRSRFFFEIKSLPFTIKLFFAVAAGLDILGLVCAAIGLREKLGRPYDSPLLGEGIGVDLTNFRPVFMRIHSLSFFTTPNVIPYMYPAPLAPLYGFFLSLPHAGVLYEITLSLLIALVATLFARSLSRAGISRIVSGLLAAATVVLSYPIWFELKQGNMEFFICLLLGAGLFCFLKNRLHIAAIFIGVAASMKIFPVVYLGLFISQRRYKPLLTAATAPTLATVTSLLYIYPSFSVSWHGVQKNLRFFTGSTALKLRVEIGYDHSLFAIVKLVAAALLGTGRATHHFAVLCSIYFIVLAIGGGALFFLRIRHLPVLNQILCLCVVSIIVPPVSYDYTLMHLYLPWILLIFFALKNKDRPVPGLKFAFVCLAVATATETEFILQASTYGGQIKAIALVLLFIAATRFRFSPVSITGPRRVPLAAAPPPIPFAQNSSHIVMAAT